MRVNGQRVDRTRSEVKNERWHQFLDGEITIADMDEEELARGQFRSKDGSFRGRPPKTVPRDFATQLSRELLQRADSSLKRRVLEAIDVLYEEMVNGEKGADRIRAANIFLERVLGKVPERVLLSAGKPEWESEVEKFLAGVEDEQIGRAQTILGRGSQ